jgi:hypothetical protein
LLTCWEGPKLQVGAEFMLVVGTAPKPKRGGVIKEGILSVSQLLDSVMSVLRMLLIESVGDQTLLYLQGERAHRHSAFADSVGKVKVRVTSDIGYVSRYCTW